MADYDGDTLAYAGCRVDLIDPEGILVEAGERRVDLSLGSEFPAPVRHVHLSVTAVVRGGRPVHLFEAAIFVDDPRSGPDRIRALVLGNDPIGLLLSRRVEAGDAWATRMVDGVGDLAEATYRRFGLDRPTTPRRTRDPETGGPGAGDQAAGSSRVVRDADADLAATVTRERVHGAATVLVRATVPTDEVGAEHLRAMVGLMLRVVVDEAGPRAGVEPLAGRRYLLGDPSPAGSAPGLLPPAPAATTRTVTLDQVGGLGEVVAELRQIAVSFQHPQAMARWGARRPQGILMYGPPGTGKTMLSRALANEIGATFREIRTPEILDRWLGGSERNIKRIFREARRYREPALILFDEFDTIISYAGEGGDAASQAINAVAGIFKQEMNNLIEDNPNVIVVATTNFPHRVDESLIRSGRFDIKLAIPLPDAATRAEIFRTMIAQLVAAHGSAGFPMFAADVDMPALAAASPGMTGADIREVLRRLQLDKAMQDARGEGPATPIDQSDLVHTIAALAAGGAARRSA